MHITRRSLIKTGAWQAPIILTSTAIPAYAASTQTTEKPWAIATNATKMSDTFDSSITSITFTDQGIIPTYGDWDANSDSSSGQRTYLQEYELTTAAPTGSPTLVNSEALAPPAQDSNGNLYYATTDPSTGHAGIWHNRNGQWKFLRTPEDYIHIFGIVHAENTLYFTGTLPTETLISSYNFSTGSFKVLYRAPGDYRSDALGYSNGNLYAFFDGRNYLKVDTFTEQTQQIPVPAPGFIGPFQIGSDVYYFTVPDGKSSGQFVNFETGQELAGYFPAYPDTSKANISIDGEALLLQANNSLYVVSGSGVRLLKFDLAAFLKFYQLESIAITTFSMKGNFYYIGDTGGFVRRWPM